MTFSVTPSIGTDGEEALSRHLGEQDVRLTRLERVYNGPNRAFAAAAVPTLVLRPVATPNSYVWVTANQQWYVYSGGTWVTSSGPPPPT